MKKQKVFLASAIVGALCLAGVTASNAATCQATGYSAAVGPSFTGFGGTYVITNFSLGGFSPCLDSTLGPQSFSAIFAGDLAINGGGAIPVNSPGMGVTVDVLSAFTVGPTTTFSNEMTQLNPPPLPGPSGPAFLRESPTLASTGQTTVTDLGGGNFQIHSFFDVFTELSIDGGNTWIPSTGPTVLTSGTPIPAALPLFTGGLGVIGLVAHRRKRKTIAA